MSREFGGRRSPEAWASAHDRARARLAERMDEPLEPAESAWLDAHLADCSSCREIDAAYRSDREGLRAMRVIPPPRDLWARTSAALDAEQARTVGGRRSRPARRRTGSPVLGFPRNRWAPLGAFGSIAAVMVVGFLLGNMIILGPSRSPSIAQARSATPNLVPTPIQVAQTDVSWVTQDADGSIVLRQAAVNDVCPAGDTSGCVPLDQNASNVATLSVKPRSIHQSPTSGQMVIIGPVSGSSGQTLYVVNVGKGAPTSVPSVGPTAPATASSTPAASSTTGATSPTAPASTAPAASSATPGTSPSPSPTPKPTATATIVPNVTPAPTAANVIALATDVGVLNADTAAYSPDGAWFAFTARQRTQASGSDIYIWHAGDAQATRVTTDRRSVFAGWVGHLLLGSRAAVAPVATGGGPSADAALTSSAAASSSAAESASSYLVEYATTSFLIDPATLARTSIPTAVWRPAVDPTGRFVVYWSGTVSADPANGGWRTATGRLVIGTWPIVAVPAPSVPAASSVAPASPSVAPSPSASDAPDATGTSAPPSSTAGPSAAPSSSSASTRSPASAAPASASTVPSSSPSPAATVAPSAASVGLPDDIATASGVDWTVAWDETGTHLAVWIGDRGDRSFGHLNLLTINGSSGSPVVGVELLSDKPALPGFSLANGHLVWATPSGTDGVGSKIYDYSAENGGINSGQGQPGVNTVIVVQH